MEYARQSGAIQGIAQALVSMDMAYKMTTFLLLAASAYRWAFPPKKQNTFPVWGPIEIAVASLVVPRGGILLRL